MYGKPHGAELDIIKLWLRTIEKKIPNYIQYLCTYNLRSHRYNAIYNDVPPCEFF